MPTITIKTSQGDRYIEFSSGRCLREILDSTVFPVRSGCNGTGACGLCRVQIKAGGLTEPSPVERIYLCESQIASGVRLACQFRPDSDLEVSILGRGAVSSWSAIPGPSPGWPAFSSATSKSSTSKSSTWKIPECAGKPCGVAVDLGTTHISLSFYDLSTGEWFAGRRGLNPQGIYGTDVMARLVAANESQEAARELRRLVVDAIGSAISDVLLRQKILPQEILRQETARERFFYDKRFDDKLGAEQVVRVALVGNTAMLALLSGRNSHLLLDPAYWMRQIDCVAENSENPRDLCLEWGIHDDAAISVVSPLAGFVGSDLLAGVLASRLVEEEPGTLLIDFGTNSEIALWDGESLWVTSAAGGPAFEGCGIGCGSPAEPGAIYRVNRKSCEPHGADETNKTYSSAGLEFRTIEDEEPRGFCGSGIVDLIASLLESGKLTSIGRFSADVSHGKIVLLNGDRQPLLLTKRDVDILSACQGGHFCRSDGPFVEGFHEPE